MRCQLSFWVLSGFSGGTRLACLEAALSGMCAQPSSRKGAPSGYGHIHSENLSRLRACPGAGILGLPFLRPALPCTLTWPGAWHPPVGRPLICSPLSGARRPTGLELCCPHAVPASPSHGNRSGKGSKHLKDQPCPHDVEAFFFLSVIRKQNNHTQNPQRGRICASPLWKKTEENYSGLRLGQPQAGVRSLAWRGASLFLPSQDARCPQEQASLTMHGPPTAPPTGLGLGRHSVTIEVQGHIPPQAHALRHRGWGPSRPTAAIPTDSDSRTPAHASGALAPCT